MLDLILPFVIFSLIAMLYILNKRTTSLKHYFHLAVIPIVGLLTARKSISQNIKDFYLNESFASWLIMMMFGGFSSTMQWYSVVGINLVCFFIYIALIFRQYGFGGVGNDFYVHMTTAIIFSGCLIRMNEVNLRSSFNLLSCSKVQEKKWQRVLMMLTDGVLILQHTENDRGILLINPSLQKIFSADAGEGGHVHAHFGAASNAASPANLAEAPTGSGELQNTENGSDERMGPVTAINSQVFNQNASMGA